MKKFKDVAHLYLGCEVKLINDISEDYDSEYYECPKVGDVGKLTLINAGNFNIQCADDAESWPYGVEFKDYAYIALWDLKCFKPLLFPLSSMSEEQMLEMEAVIKMFDRDYVITDDMHKEAMDNIRAKGIDAIVFDEDNNPLMVFELVRLFLSQHFDLFNLIENGEALDKTSLK